MNEKIKESRYEMKNKRDFIIVSMVFIINIVFVIVKGVEIRPDTQGYIDMNLYREPLYPLFLFVFRFLFPESIYLNVVIFVQALLVSYATCNCFFYLKKQLRITGFVELLVLGCLFMSTLVNGMLASGKSIYVNAILSEGLAIPLWFLFWRYMIEFILESSNRSKWRAYALSILLMLTRSQMEIALVIWVVVIFAISFLNHEKNLASKYAKTVLQVILGFLLVAVLSRSYNLVVNGVFVDNIAGNDTKVTHVLYVANQEDADVFEDEDLKQLYSEIWDHMNAGEALDDYSGKGMYNHALHMETNHDFIKYQCMDPLVRSYVLEKEGKYLTEVELNTSMNKIFHTFISELLRIHLKEWIYGYLSLAFIGFVRTVAPHRLFLYAILIYIIYVMLLIYCVKRNRSKKVVSIAVFSLLCIAVNVAAVSLFIMCINRFMLYSMPFFYISLLLMTREILYEYENRRNESSCTDTMLQ